MNDRERRQRIRELNDGFRKSMSGGRVMMTIGFQSLSEKTQAIAIHKIAGFEHFTADNDPHGEHDFGSIGIEDQPKIFWKIDYYSPDLEHGSEEPSDPTKTARVMTIMLAEEY